MTMATMKPPKSPIISSGATVAKSCVCKNEFHVQAAVAMQHSSRMPVLLIAPLRVMRAEASIRLPPYWLRATSLNVFWPRAGFEVLKSAMNFSV